MPPLPNTYRQLFGKLNLDSSAVESLVNSPNTAAFIKDVMENQGEDHAKRIANWIVNTVSKQLEGEEAETAAQLPSADKAAKLSQMVADNKLSSTAAKDVWLEMTAKGGDPEEIAEAKNLVQVSDEGAIAEIVASVLKDNPKAAEDVKNGEMKAIGFLVGQIMKASQGKANPAMAQELIKKQLGQNG
jgi:aspartyl-tRNA(Asn)/glutamyl-tRNA(Gln) amidotransferase subunit B